MNLRSIEAKAFVPATDFNTSLQFYRDVGFTLAWSTGQLAYFRHDNSVFLLQDFYVPAHIENFMMHLLVESADDWWQHIQAERIPARYNVNAEPPADRPWGMRDFTLHDPSGVLWRVGQPIVRAA